MSKIVHEVPNGVFIVTLGEYGEGMSPLAVFSTFKEAEKFAEKRAAHYLLSTVTVDETGSKYRWTDFDETLIVEILVFDVLGEDKDEANLKL